MSKPEVRLENWSVTQLNPYYPPEAQYSHLRGDVVDHPRIGKMQGVVTSRIIGVDGRKVETNNTIYVLGTIDPGYMDFCIKAGGYIPTEEVPVRFKKDNNDVE